jgi:rod shape-determining protein MreD
LKNVSLWFPFSLAVFFVLYGSIIIPDVKLFAFAPFFALLFQRTSYVKSLWLSTFCGIIMDIFSSQQRFGVYGICYALCCIVCYHQKRHFFEEKSIAISFFSALISSIGSLIFLIFTYLFDKQFSITLDLLISETLFTPVLDALYAFIWFTLPIQLYKYVRSGKWKIFFQKQEETT